MTIIIIYILGGIGFLSLAGYLLQDKLIFRPEKLPAGFEYKFDIPFKELFFDIEEGVRINGLQFYRPAPEGLVLYFHGNTRSIKGWARYAKDFYRYNYDVILLDYRGFGKSTGKREEQKMLADMQFVYMKLTQLYQERHLILYGRSLGSGFAAKLAADNNPLYLILDSPFYNFGKVVSRFIPFLPVRMILRYQLRTDTWIRSVRCHTYILHGTKDWLIPIKQSEQLQQLNPLKITLIRIQGGGHNNLPSYPEYHNFIRDILAP